MNFTNQLPSKEIMRDKIHGCWIGKNIGGTLGAPMEGDTSMHDISWFVEEPGGNPLPNDDLDLQLLWLVMTEFYGLEHLTTRHFGEMWLHVIAGPWGEYSNCRYNCQLGFFPPLSGACENEGQGCLYDILGIWRGQGSFRKISAHARNKMLKLLRLPNRVRP